MEWTRNTSTALFATLISLTVLSGEVVRRFIRDRIERKGYPLPPGPPSLPFLGSVLSVDTREPLRTYMKWYSTYGDVVYVRLLDMDAVVLNTPSVATELLEKRSQIYSDRPFNASANPYGHDFDLSLARYGDHWRLCRRIFHQTFRAEAVVKFYPMQLHKARELILNMIDEPSDYISHYATAASSVTMRSVYDYDPSPRNDEMVSTANRFLEASLQALLPENAGLFKMFPFRTCLDMWPPALFEVASKVLHIPDGLPGSSIKHGARRARELGAKMVEVPYQYVQRRLASKEDINPSMVSDHIARMGEFDNSHRLEYERALKAAASTAFLASVETSSSVLTTFTLAMVKNPRIRKRAQENIDAALGTARLPEFGDRSSLPYIDAILRESLRWQPPAPLGVPHATTQSDIYNGFYIPKGATVFANAWGISRDQTRYPNPDEFIPERFLDGSGMLTNEFPDFVFGFGRRVCPGRHAAQSFLWIAIATMLAAFDFDLAKDVDGKDIEFEPEFSSIPARHPLPFPCRITPRSHINRETIERILAKEVFDLKV